ncbi:hypothetical protein [Aeromicrobium sp. Root472D3]|uniref:hypothetical protein n=1 Tax=Aeromicrobium sp. Root472D3 TaxID=1736540 RepID=UPI0006FB6EE3|nr:hypothetical protein [Aeromicrobium sp. Root472D3]KQX76278.1 hypothetical protein ASD10_14465 [Aeromicrobium sp. Root472D3]
MPCLLTRAVAALIAAVAVASCTAAPDGQGDAASDGTRSWGHEVEGAADAVWALGPGQPISTTSTSFTALVTRLGCNDGVTGDVVDPVVRTSRTRIVVTFQVTPGEPGAARCPGNRALPYVVDLEDPVGRRQLVDGRCLPDGAAETT